MAQAESVNSAICGLTTGASAYPPTSIVCTTHAEFLAVLNAYGPRSVPVNASAADLDDCANHSKKLIPALSAYLVALLDDIAENVPGGLDLRQIDALLSDLASDVSGTLQRAIERMAWRVS